MLAATPSAGGVRRSPFFQYGLTDIDVAARSSNPGTGFRITMEFNAAVFHLRGFFLGNNGIGTRRNRSAGKDTGHSVGLKLGSDVTGKNSLRNREIAATACKIGAANGIAVHLRIIQRRDFNFRDDVLGEDFALPNKGSPYLLLRQPPPHLPKSLLLLVQLSAFPCFSVSEAKLSDYEASNSFGIIYIKNRQISKYRVCRIGHDRSDALVVCANRCFMPFELAPNLQTKRFLLFGLKAFDNHDVRRI